MTAPSDIGPGQFTKALEDGTLEIDTVRLKAFRSNRGPGTFELSKRTFKNTSDFVYRFLANADRRLLKGGGRAYIGAGTAFMTAQDAVDHAHDTHGVFLKQHLAK